MAAAGTALAGAVGVLVERPLAGLLDASAAAAKRLLFFY
jgi:hypothetical protein